MLLSLLSSRAALYAGAAVAVLVAGAAMLHQHDTRVRAEMQVAQDQAIATATAENQRLVHAALTALQTAQAQRDTALAATRRTINAAPRTTACTSSPAVGAALDSLRAKRGAGPAPTHP